jgi:hypothetical protein
MANDISMSDAVQHLKEHFGTELRAGRDEGRDMMAEVLAERLSIGEGEARELVDALEASRSIRWVDTDGTVQEVTINAPSTGQGMPLGVNDAYWQF